MRVSRLWLAVWMVVAGLAVGTPRLRGQSFEVLDGNLRVTSLDGFWRFHTGDDPAWAHPRFDDSKWALLKSTEGWSSQGYKEYSAMAWYFLLTTRFSPLWKKLWKNPCQAPLITLQAVTRCKQAVQ